MAPTANTGILGLQESGSTGKIVGFQGYPLAGNGLLSFVSDSYVAVTGAQAETRLFLASTSGQYHVMWNIEVTSVGVAGGVVFPTLKYSSYGGGPGGGFLNIMQAQSGVFTNQRTAYSGAFWIRSAASDIFISTAGNGIAGVPPVYNMNWSIFQASS